MSAVSVRTSTIEGIDMKKNIEHAVMESLRQAVAIHRGAAKPSRTFALPLTAREVQAVPAPSYSALKIAALRKRLGCSQPAFARILNVSLPTVRAWEQDQRHPDGAAVRLLQLVEGEPTSVFNILKRARRTRSKVHA
jgi:putative transcriptional regulator